VELGSTDIARDRENHVGCGEVNIKEKFYGGFKLKILMGNFMGILWGIVNEFYGDQQKHVGLLVVARCRLS